MVVKTAVYGFPVRWSEKGLMLIHLAESRPGLYNRHSANVRRRTHKCGRQKRSVSELPCFSAHHTFCHVPSFSLLLFSLATLLAREKHEPSSVQQVQTSTWVMKTSIPFCFLFRRFRIKTIFQKMSIFYQLHNHYGHAHLEILSFIVWFYAISLAK